MKVVLIGFMGAGKSTVANELSELLDLPSVEMDDLILKQSGRSSVNDIFSVDGEIRFRELEADVARRLSTAQNVIISAGGGVIGNRSNIEFLRMNKGRLVYLETGFETLAARLLGDATRPLFHDKARAQELYDKRRPAYEGCAEFCIATDSDNPKGVAIKISDWLKSNR